MDKFDLKEAMATTQKRNKNTNHNPNSNTLANVIKIIGIIQLIVGVLIGLGTGGVFELFWIVGSILTGVFAIGFGEIINLLHSINRKLDKSKQDEGVTV